MHDSEDASGPLAPPASRPPIARYANYFEVGHNALEFLIDAGQVEPQSGEIRFTERTAINPVNAKLLAELLQRAVEQFEDEFEPIPSIIDEAERGFMLTTPEDFERRALDARRRRNPTPPPPQER